jgi:hypothetical protein
MDARKCPNSCNVIVNIEAITNSMVELIIIFFSMGFVLFSFPATLAMFLSN